MKLPLRGWFVPALRRLSLALVALGVLGLAVRTAMAFAFIYFGGPIGDQGSGFPVLGGTDPVFTADADHTATQAEYAGEALRVTSTVPLTQTRQLFLPLFEGETRDVYNGTTGGQAIVVGGVTGSAVSILNGTSARVQCVDGANYKSVSGNTTITLTGQVTGTSSTGTIATTVPALWQTTGAFTQPAVGATVVVPFTSVTGVATGRTLLLADSSGNGGWYLVQSIASLNVTLLFEGGPGSAGEGTTVATSAIVTLGNQGWFTANQAAFFGDGSDGVLTPGASGALLLSRDMYFSAVADWPAGSTYVIDTVDYRIFVSGKFSLKNACSGTASGCIFSSGGSNGGAASGGTAGNGGAAGGAGSGQGLFPFGTGGAAGATGVTCGGGNVCNGTAGGNLTPALAYALGGAGGTAGNGGNSVVNTDAGNIGQGGTGGIGFGVKSFPLHLLRTELVVDGHQLQAGGGGGGGASGGGDSTGDLSGGGGGGGGAANPIQIFANELYADATTGSGTGVVFEIQGGHGGVGGNVATLSGAGGGGGGAGGGLLVLGYANRSGTGSTATVNCVGGAGAAGGTGPGPGGFSGGGGGNGGAGGNGGTLVVMNFAAGTVTSTSGAAGAAGGTTSTGTGGTGGAGGACALAF